MTRTALLEVYDRELATTRRMLERIPADKMEWKPHPKSATMAGLGRHLAHMLTWGLLGLTKTTSDVGDRTPPDLTATPDDILRMFDTNAAATRALLATLPDAALDETWTLTWQGNAVMTSTREAVVQSMILSHAIHHRGQLSVYLRLNDIPVPSIYGPSADEPPS
jgi:uncharacterized damage-inducible protein DinB